MMSTFTKTQISTGALALQTCTTLTPSSPKSNSHSLQNNLTVESIKHWKNSLMKNDKKSENLESKISEIKEFPTTTHSEGNPTRKRKASTLNPPSSFWIQRYPKKKKLGQRYKNICIQKAEQRRTMLAFNVLWLKNDQNTNEQDLPIEKYVKGGKNEDSFYINQLNQPSGDAIAIVLSQGPDVYVAMLQGFETIFVGFSRGVADGVLPTKASVSLNTPEKVRGIANRIALTNGFSNGIGQCRCMTVEIWDAVMAKLQTKIPKMGSTKAVKNPLQQIQLLVNEFNEEYVMQVDLFGLERNHETSMYQEQLDKVIHACARLWLTDGAGKFREALALLTNKKDFIKSQAGVEAVRLKKDGTDVTATTNVTVTTTVQEGNVRIQIENLRMRVRNVATCIKNNNQRNICTHHVCQQMLDIPSAYVTYVGPNNVPQHGELISATGSDNGNTNDHISQVLGQRGRELWLGVLTLVLSAKAKKLDCSQIRAEKNAIGEANRQGDYSSSGHMGKVALANSQGGHKKQNATFRVDFSMLIKHSVDKNIATYWKKTFTELEIMVTDFFPNDTDRAIYFDQLQYHVGMASHMSKLSANAQGERSAAIASLKWVFVLYCELFNGAPTTVNFVSTMLSPMGVSLCDSYLAWISTAYYNLKSQAHRVVEGTLDRTTLPSWIKLEDRKTKPDVTNSAFGKIADDIFKVLEAWVRAEWDETLILTAAQQNVKFHKKTHNNIHLGRAAGAWAWWLVGCCRITQYVAPRSGILEKMSFMTEKQWKELEPGKNSQRELRLGLTFITNSYRDIRMCHADKTCGPGIAATPLFEAHACFQQLTLNGEWTGVDANSGVSWDTSSLQNSLLRLKEAAVILGGDPDARKYLLNVKKDNTYRIMTSTFVPSPVTPIYSKNHMYRDQNPEDTFEELMAPLKNITRISKKSLKKLAEQHITPCFRPPKRTNHTIAKNPKTRNFSNTAKRIAELFKICIAPAIVTGSPLVMGKEWSLNSVKTTVGLSGNDERYKYLVGYCPGKILASDKYTFKTNNVPTAANLSRYDSEITQSMLDSVKLYLAEVMNGRCHVHPTFFGRQTAISKLIATRQCLRQIPDWDDGEVYDKRVVKKIVAMSRLQQHELPKIIEKHYLDVHKTPLGSPDVHHAKFDERIRAHPTKPIFSLRNGIESWPETLVQPNQNIDTSIKPILHAFTDVRNLTIAEQNLNLATLTCYKDSLTWIIDNQQWLRDENKHGILRWFKARAAYDPASLATPVRASPRKRRKTKHND